VSLTGQRIDQQRVTKISDIRSLISTMPCPASIPAVPSDNGKKQPWQQAWPPKKADLAGVTESRGQMLLLDGTGGSGTVAVPNSVMLPPKSLEKPESLV
jgi:hypothetical protein